MSSRYEIIGSYTSPFSCKLRGILRYRRLPHVWRLRQMNMSAAIEAVRPKLVPILGFPKDDGSYDYRVDSTPLAYELEARHAERSLLPADPAQAFLCHLIEDFADEWCSKMMYHYRWIEDATAGFGAKWIIADWLPDAVPAVRAKFEQQIFDRQRSRMAMVGVGGGTGNGPGNGQIIEADFRELLKILGPYVSAGRFLFGSRPSLADFGLYGQLSPMIVDPLPQRIIREHAPAVEFWVIVLDDASGIEGRWDFAPGAAVREQLLEIIGRSYLPFLAANAAALEAGQAQFELEIGGRPFRMAPQGYQAKCLKDIRNRWAALDAGVRTQLKPLMAETGCMPFLNGGL